MALEFRAVTSGGASSSRDDTAASSSTTSTTSSSSSMSSASSSLLSSASLSPSPAPSPSSRLGLHLLQAPPFLRRHFLPSAVLQISSIMGGGGGGLSARGGQLSSQAIASSSLPERGGGDARAQDGSEQQVHGVEVAIHLGTPGRPLTRSVSSNRIHHDGAAITAAADIEAIGTSAPLPSGIGQDAARGVDAGNVTGNVATTAATTTATELDLQIAARWLEQALPFCFLLFLVFLHQHCYGIITFGWLTLCLARVNELIRKQVALKEERELIALGWVSVLLLIHVGGVYYLFESEALWRPLVMIPPAKIPTLWDAIWNVAVNDVLIRFVAMVVKAITLMTYGHKSARPARRQQSQLLTVVEHFSLFYRALAPMPVWYRFFLNDAYGRLFSSLLTGLYLGFKVTSSFEKVCTLVSSIRSLRQSDLLYGQYASHDEVMEAGDLCAICQEKMKLPISLVCRHVFCEECVSEWFDRERTCPLCRAVVKAAGMCQFGDGSTSLLLQIF
eukprot:jgi/Chlat1/2370/Chrsp17S02642